LEIHTYRTAQGEVSIRKRMAEDYNNLLNEIENDNQNSLELFNNYGSYRLGYGFYHNKKIDKWIKDFKNDYHSKNYIPSDGGYCKLIKELNQKINRNFVFPN
tara:strand:+ start:129 stop:434 length:306 start_codon:yes stop_codon:yes gene_type:complete